MRFLILIFVISFIITEEIFEVTKIYLTGEDKEIIKYDISEKEKKIIEKYILDINGNIIEYKNFDNPESFYINNPQLLNSNKMKEFLSGYWESVKFDKFSSYYTTKQGYFSFFDTMAIHTTITINNFTFNDSFPGVKYLDYGELLLMNPINYKCKINPINKDLVNIQCYIPGYIPGIFSFPSYNAEYKRAIDDDVIKLINQTELDNKERKIEREKISNRIKNINGWWYTEKKLDSLYIKYERRNIRGRKSDYLLISNLFRDSYRNMERCILASGKNNLNDSIIIVSKQPSLSRMGFQEYLAIPHIIEIKYFDNNVIMDLDGKKYTLFKNQK